MTEKNIINKVSKDTGYSPEVVEPILTDIFKVISDSVMTEKIVQIRGFGSFHLKHLGRRVMAKHYMSGEEAVTPEHYKINFLAYADLKRRAERKLQRKKKKEEEAANAEM